MYTNSYVEESAVRKKKIRGSMWSQMNRYLKAQCTAYFVCLGKYIVHGTGYDLEGFSYFVLLLVSPCARRLQTLKGNCDL